VDRDDVYLLVKTPKKNNAIYITEDTQEHEPNEIWISYNTKRTAIKIDENGIHIFTKDNETLKVTLDQKVEIVKSSSTKIGENGIINIQNDYDVRVTGNITMSAEGDIKISANGKLELYSAGRMVLNSDSSLLLYPPASLSKVISFNQAKEAEGVPDL